MTGKTRAQTLLDEAMTRNGFKPNKKKKKKDVVKLKMDYNSRILKKDDKKDGKK